MERCNLCLDLKCCPEHCCDWDTCECMDCDECGPKSHTHSEAIQPPLCSTHVEKLEEGKTRTEDGAIIINFGELHRSKSQQSTKAQTEEPKPQEISSTRSEGTLEGKEKQERVAAGRGLFGIRAIRNSRS